VLDLTGEVSGNGLEADVLRVVDIVDGGREICGDALLLTVFSMADEYGIGTEVHTYGPVLSSIVVDDVVDDTGVVAKEGIERLCGAGSGDGDFSYDVSFACTNVCLFLLVATGLAVGAVWWKTLWWEMTMAGDTAWERVAAGTY